MDKQTAVDFNKTLEKYAMALCGTMYPSQIEQLQRALALFKKNGQILKLDDSFANLAFRMIVADILWQEKWQEGA